MVDPDKCEPAMQDYQRPRVRSRYSCSATSRSSIPSRSIAPRIVSCPSIVSGRFTINAIAICFSLLIEIQISALVVSASAEIQLAGWENFDACSRTFGRLLRFAFLRVDTFWGNSWGNLCGFG